MFLLLLFVSFNVYGVDMNFWDRVGRLHTKPITANDPYPTNNAYIYTAYYKVLYPVTPFFYQQLRLPDTMPFSRHPDAIGPAISHDELTGVSILSKEKAKEICEYLKNNHNQFSDLPGFVSKPLYSLNPIKVYRAFQALGKEEKQRTAVIKYPDMWNFAFWQRPEYRWVYKRAAGITPSLWEKAVFLIARGVSVLRWKKEEPNLLLYFSLKHLKQENNLGIEGTIIQMYMNTIVHDMYDDEHEMLKYGTKDLPAQYYSVHPWITG
jgi:hypothetical protein